jgi:hypothetical protein
MIGTEGFGPHTLPPVFTGNSMKIDGRLRAHPKSEILSHFEAACGLISPDEQRGRVAAFGTLDIGFGCAAHQHEMLGRRRDVRAKCGSRERLAIGAVADAERVGINFRFEGNLAAMTAALCDIFAAKDPLSRGTRQ